MSEQSKLEILANDARLKNTVKNNFSNETPYSDTSTYALSDKETPEDGKGTGTYLDFQNGGSIIDIEGNPHMGSSGRKGNMVKNKYGKTSTYQTPDTSSNDGQINL